MSQSGVSQFVINSAGSVLLRAVAEITVRQPADVLILEPILNNRSSELLPIIGRVDWQIISRLWIGDRGSGPAMTKKDVNHPRHAALDAASLILVRPLTN